MKCYKDPDWVKNADLMWKQSVWSSAIAATIAVKCLKVITWPLF